MKKFACPSCGAEVVFQSSATTFMVCAYCRSMLVRQDQDLTNLGKMADLQEDATPLQLGTRGNYKGDGFTLLGRLQQRWEDGAWNEWYALFDSGKQGWVAEAQGYYMVSFEVELKPEATPRRADLRPEIEVSLPGGRYTVDDVKETTCAASEGELPFPAPSGQKALSVDLSGPKKRFANLVYGDGSAQLYVGEYIEFDHLQFSNLRKLDGW